MTWRRLLAASGPRAGKTQWALAAGRAARRARPTARQEPEADADGDDDDDDDVEAEPPKGERFIFSFSPSGPGGSARHLGRMEWRG